MKFAMLFACFLLTFASVPALWLGAKLVENYNAFAYFPVPSLVCVLLAGLCMHSAESI